MIAPEGQTGSQRVQSTMQLNGLATVIFGRHTPDGSEGPGSNTPGLQRSAQASHPLQSSASMVGNQAISSRGASKRFFFFAGDGEPLLTRAV